MARLISPWHTLYASSEDEIIYTIKFIGDLLSSKAVYKAILVVEPEDLDVLDKQYMNLLKDLRIKVHYLATIDVGILPRGRCGGYQRQKAMTITHEAGQAVPAYEAPMTRER